jgi:methylmalonyl-CoA/ethylmalonyl-CoA epimerase
MHLFEAFDHLAIAVPNTTVALKTWRDKFGFPVLYSEVVNGGAVRLTHLDLGNAHLQLVQPLVPGHPLQAWLAQHGPGLHHFCLRVAEVSRGKRALFLSLAAAQGVQVEITGP